MNNKIYKLFSLILILLVIATGCKNNEGKVNKIKKQDDLNNSESIKQENILHYYDIIYSKYNDNKKLLEDYNNKISNYKENSNNIELINNDENMYEAFLTLIPIMSESMSGPHYTYILIIKNNNEYIELNDYTTDGDKTYMQGISKELKRYIAKYNTLKEAFDAYSKDYNLSIDNTGIEDSSITEYLSASNEYTVVQYDKNGIVESVVLENIDLTNGKVKTLAVGKSKDKKRVWSLDLGISDKSINYKDTLCVSLGKKYAYVAHDGIIDARDINTGKLVWQSPDEVGFYFEKVIETDNYVLGFRRDGQGIVAVGLNINNGSLQMMDSINSYDKELKKWYNKYDLKNLKVSNDIVELSVLYDGNDSSVYDENTKYQEKVVGTVTIDIKNKSITFNKTK